MRSTQMLICLAAIWLWYTKPIEAQTIIPGDIIITEFMANPSAASDSEGEYIELYNRRAIDIDLSGFWLADMGTDRHKIAPDAPLIIPAESFLKLAISTNAGFTVDYVYDGITLSNAGDEIILRDTAENLIAQVTYLSSQVSAGVALELDSLSHIGHNGEAKGEYYLPANQDIGNGDVGSPGSAGNSDLTETPSLRLMNYKASVNEDIGLFDIDVMLEDPDGKEVMLSIDFVEEPATAEPEDLVMTLSQTLKINESAVDGEIASAVFTLNNDDKFEGNEIAVFRLSSIMSEGAVQLLGDSLYHLTILDDEVPKVVINEIHADPDSENGDADGSGVVNSSDDEFVEVVNSENVSVDIGNWTLSDAIGVKHTFEENTVLTAGGAAVVFGGFDYIGSFGNAMVQGTGSLSLNNGGDKVVLKNEAGITIDSLSYGSEGGKNQSLVRDPEITGSLTKHSLATGSSERLYSPGTRTTGQLFSDVIPIEGKAGWRMLSAPVANMPISEIMDDTPIQGYGDGLEKNFYNGYDGSTYTTPADLSGELPSGSGFLLYFFNNEDENSSHLPVYLDVGNGSEPSGDVQVSLHSNGDKWNLLGNPYQSAFDLSAITPIGGNLSSTVGQVWSDAEGSYMLSTLNDGKIAVGQGFFLQNVDASALNFPISGKTNGTKFYKKINESAYLQLALKAISKNGEPQLDLATVLYFNPKAKSDKDAWDVEKLIPLKSSYALLLLILEDGEEKYALAQDARSYSMTQSEVYDLGVESVGVRSGLELSWYKSKGIPDNWSFTLIDHEIRSEWPMEKGFQYYFSSKENIGSENAGAPPALKSVSYTSGQQALRFSIRLDKLASTNMDKRSEKKDPTRLFSNYPNPFNTVTQISYRLSIRGVVQLSVFDTMGREVAKLVDSDQPAGFYQIPWDASSVASGIYYYRLRTGTDVVSRKMTLIK